MSCVVGLVDGERVWLGGDSAAFTEDVVVSYTSPKVFRKGKMIMGCVESFRMRDIIEHYFTAPRCTKLVAEETYVAAVVESLRACFQQHGYDLEAQVDDGRPDMAESGAILIGFRGRLFTIDWDWHVGELLDPYMAIGAGAPFALGSLAESADKGYTPRLRILNALKVSAHYSPSVEPPFKILSGK